MSSKLPFYADSLKSTSVTLYKSDIEELTSRGLSVSETIRELLHHIISYDATDIFFSVRRGQAYEHIATLDKRILKLSKQQSIIQADINELTNRRNEILKRQDIIESQCNEAKTWKRICELGSTIDTFIYLNEFDITKIMEMDIPEIAEMEAVNPGWSLLTHIEMKKKLTKRF
ncbi:MAG: hypothetical protein D4S01_00850 [Dehalococcoidia bacterium]|nr:MAG: hypothetical protein D4S01_00850 [Dehalococcoidia bacterium]